MSDSHTAFHAPSFTGAAVGGAMTIAGALVSGMQNAAQANASAWANYNREQLEKTLDLSEALRKHAVHRAEKAEGKLRKIKMLALKRARGRARA
ncbi:hypothetical protein ACTGJ9_018455 [Bradyrhizobium sp. RDM12]